MPGEAQPEAAVVGHSNRRVSSSVRIRVPSVRERLPTGGDCAVPIDSSADAGGQHRGREQR